MQQGKKINEIISTRDKLYDYLCECGIDKAISFKIVDLVRKGKWKSLSQEMMNELHAKVPDWYVDSMSKITYLFPSAHSYSYMMAAVRIAYFKLYYPAAYYAAVLTRYGNKTNVSNFAYDKAINISSLQEYEAYQKYIKTESTRAEQEKDAIRLALIIYEMRLRGFTVGNATLNSHHRNFAIDPNNQNIIIRPLSSIAGIGEGASVKIYNNIQSEGVGTVDELYDRVVMIDNEDGTFSAKRIFTDSVLIKLGLPVPPDLTDDEKSLCKKFKIATSKFSKTQVRTKLEYFRLNPPYEVTEKDKLLARALKIKEKDFETTTEFKKEINAQCLITFNTDDKLCQKIKNILNSGE